MASNANPELGGQARARRCALGLTQEQLSRRAGCSTSSVRFLERGWTPSAAMVKRIMRALEREEAKAASTEEVSVA
jgi:predicted transcriptional regulator